jgi:hypothetical protein
MAFFSSFSSSWKVWHSTAVIQKVFIKQIFSNFFNLDIQYSFFFVGFKFILPKYRLYGQIVLNSIEEIMGRLSDVGSR